MAMAGEEQVALLNTGAKIPLLGFGTAGTATLSLEEQKSAIATAIQTRYRHFDTASMYRSEEALGCALQEAFQAGTLKRERVFVTTKIWCSEMDDVMGAIKRSLSALQLEYLDLYLIHWPLKCKSGVKPTFEDIHPLDIKESWPAMEKCMELGLTKSIGISNFSSKKIRDLLQIAKIPPSVNQVEMHPRWQQKQLRRTCKEANIHVSGWSPLGAPQTKWGTASVIDHPVIKEIAAEHGRTPAQVVLRWGLEQGVSVLPKSIRKERILENFQVFGWSLTKEDHERIEMIEQQRNMSGPFLRDGSIYNSPDLWDGEN